ncbi:RNA polymerase subunit sigma-70 [Kitasatospora aureofaciens]|uniref:RNA polymerase subunit sigma-70 n=1 Tax=Kitasatospora aureofaciens TaxID=1894 RepID=UPI00382FD5FC
MGRTAGSAEKLGELDEEAFTRLAERHRRELHVHCYRMLASYDEAEDAVQETLLRAWRGRREFDGGPLARAWLYRIATNVCLDLHRSRARRPQRAAASPEVSWLQPYPDRLLDEAAPPRDEPDAAAVGRETIELAFVAALQALPGRQRAAFVARDVLGWPAKETAALLETSVAATNSALQRARATMQECLPARRDEWTGRELSAEERDVLARFIEAHERCDAAAAIAISAETIHVTMPPYPSRYDGIDALVPLLERAFDTPVMGEWRLLPTAANRLPTAASYLRAPGDTRFRAFKFDVLRVERGRIQEITVFGPHLFPAFGLPTDL